MNCGYSLQGLHPSGMCPECGTPCEHSLRGNLLAFAGEAYLRSLLRGSRMIMVAVLLQLAMVVASLAISFLVVPAKAPQMNLAISIVGVGVNALFLYGWWRFSEPDPGYVGQRTGADARQVVRASTLAMAGLSVVGLAVQFLFLSTPIPTLGSTQFLVMAGVGLLGVVAIAAQFFASMLYIRWLAPRLPNKIVYARARRYMWLLPVLNTVGYIFLMLGPVLSMLFYRRLMGLIAKDLSRIAAERGLPPVRAGIAPA